MAVGPPLGVHLPGCHTVFLRVARHAIEGAGKLRLDDPAGYDGETSDPLYKVAPFLICDDRDSGVAYGVLYDNLATAEIDVGATIGFDFGHGHGVISAAAACDRLRRRGQAMV